MEYFKSDLGCCNIWIVVCNVSNMKTLIYQFTGMAKEINNIENNLNERSYLMGIAKKYLPETVGLWEKTGKITERQYGYLLALHFNKKPETTIKFKEILGYD